MNITALKAFNRAAATYDRAAHLQQNVGEWLLDALPDALPEGGEALDVGTGTGWIAHRLHKRFPHNTIFATDAAAAMLRSARRPFLSCFQSDAAMLPLPHNRLALLTANMVLQWLPDPLGAVKHWFSLLAPGGWLVLTWPVQGTFSTWHQECRRLGMMPAFTFSPPFGQTLLYQTIPIKSEQRCWSVGYDSWRSFIRELQATGANSPNTAQYTPLRRRALSALDRHQIVPVVIEYHLERVLIQKS
jgi:malonyl-CoA O-methyltransferase